MLFVAWGYLHRGAAPTYLDAIAGTLGLVVPLLFLVGLAGFYACCKGQAGWLGRTGFVLDFIGVGLGVVHPIMDVSGVVDAATRYAYFVEKGWLPQLLIGFPGCSSD